MTQQELSTKESNALVKAGEGKASAVDVQAERVVLSLAIPLRNGQWENYPKTYSVWKKATPDLYQKAQALKEGHEIWVQWTEKPAERGVYRDVVAMGRKRYGDEAPSTTPAPTDQSSSEMWDAMGPATATRPPTMPASPPAPASHTQDTQRASSEAQKALAVASELLRDFLTVENVPLSEKVELTKKYLPLLTMVAVAAIHEARRE